MTGDAMDSSLRCVSGDDHDHFHCPNIMQSDVPRWLSFLIVLGMSASVPISLVFYSTDYLTSQYGYADGGDMYSHIAEALVIKQQLERGETNLWFPSVTLGYPILMAYHPLPSLVTAASMIAAERYFRFQPLRTFRWLFAGLLTALPWTWYIGSRQIGLTRLQSSLVSLGVFAMRSWASFGLELTAFHTYGLYTQAYGMLMLPLAVSLPYNYVLYGKRSGDVAAVAVTLNLLSHTIFGIYAMLFTITLVTSMILVKIFLTRGTHSLVGLLSRALEVHGKCFVLCGWWIVPMVWCYDYIGGLPWKYDIINPYTLDIVIRQLLSGEVYDYGRGIPYITLGTLVGIFCIFIGHDPVSTKVEQKTNRTLRRQVLYVWLALSFLFSLCLFFGRGTFGWLYELIPFHREIDSLRYLGALHFLGLLLSAMGTSFALIHVAKFITRHSDYSFNQLVIMVMLLGLPLHLSNQSQTLAKHLTVTEISSKVRNRMQLLKEHPIMGRLYGDKDFGTDGPWELSILPYYTGKPGIKTYSRGFHDSLTVYYLEAFYPNLTITPWFPDLLRLCNIRYIVAKAITTDFLQQCRLSKLMKVDKETTVYIRSPEEVYGYFEFIHVPGTIQGDLKDIRQTVVTVLQICQVRALLAINSDENHPHNATAKVVIKPVTRALVGYSWFSRFLQLLVPPEKHVANWTFSGVPVSESDFLGSVMNMYIFRPIRSVVLKESASACEYSAMVEVHPEAVSKNIYSTEHLLLKVTYHPYWACRYTSMITQDSSETKENTDQEYEKWKELEVYHVIPNMMSVILPPGRHEVVCSYSNPLYQKVGFVLFLFIISMILVNETLQQYRKLMSTYTTEHPK